MTKGWSVDILGGIMFLLIARLMLHLSGFGEARLLQAIGTKWSIVAVLFPITSLKRAQERLSLADLSPAELFVISGLILAARVSMLLGAVFFGVLGVLAIVTAFFGEPL